MLQPYLHYNHDLERHVLADCLMAEGAFSMVHHLLSEECFHHHGCVQLYRALLQVWQNGYAPDTLSITQQLYHNGTTEIDGISAAAYIGILCDDCLPSPHLATRCVQLRELAARRILLRITDSSITHGDDVVTAATQMQELLTQAMQVRTVNDWHHAHHAADELCHYIEAPHTPDDDSISTTFRAIDDANGGLRPGQLIVLGARPAMGKSALAGNIALAAAQAGRHVGFISMEMPARELFTRMVSQHSGIAYKLLERPAPGTRSLVARRVRELAALPLHFADTAAMCIHDIRARAEQLQRTTGLHLLVVDYLQLIAEHGDSRRSREQNISAISRGLKMLAMNLHIPVIALSQLNRESEHRSNKRPTLADLRESGAIEQDADIVMLLHRDYRSGIETDAEGNSTEQQADLMVAKWRNGKCFDLKLHFYPQTMMFSEGPT